MGRLNVGDQVVNMTLAVGPSNGTGPVQEVTFGGSVTIIYDLVGGTNLQFVTRATSPEAAFIDELATDVWVMGDVIQARFRAWAVWQEWFSNGQDNVSVMAVTYKKLLSRRNVVPAVGLSFTNTDIGDILWGMWQHTQAQTGGDLKVTAGTRTTGLVRTRNFKQGENLGQLAEAEYEEGVWWDIDTNLVFKAGAINAGPYLDIPLQLGLNCREMQRASGSDFANAVYGDADSQSTTPVWVVSSDIATDPRGRWELAQGWPTVTLQQTLVDRATGFLQTSHTPVAHWNIDLEPERWVTDSKLMPGMFATLVVPRTLAAPIGDPAPKIVVMVTQLSVSFDDNGQLEVKVVVQERPDLNPVPALARVGVARVGRARVGFG